MYRGIHQAGDSVGYEQSWPANSLSLLVTCRTSACLRNVFNRMRAYLILCESSMSNTLALSF